LTDKVVVRIMDRTSIIKVQKEKKLQKKHKVQLKTFSINSTIDWEDLRIKCNKTLAIIQKGNLVKFTIVHNGNSTMENPEGFQAITEHITTLRNNPKETASDHKVTKTAIAIKSKATKNSKGNTKTQINSKETPTINLQTTKVPFNPKENTIVYNNILKILKGNAAVSGPVVNQGKKTFFTIAQSNTKQKQ
jgi:hypothetical protein